MNIIDVIDKSIELGHLTPAMSSLIDKFLAHDDELKPEEWSALKRLMEALETGEVVELARKQFINVMEEMVLEETLHQAAEIEYKENCILDIGAIVAFSLNRLPPLYATTEVGAEYQRKNAKESELNDTIIAKVQEAILTMSERPEFHPERKGIGEEKEDIYVELRKFAEKFEVK